VLDHHERAARDLENARLGIPHLDHAVWIEVGRRFLKQQQARLHEEHAGAAARKLPES